MQSRQTQGTYGAKKAAEHLEKTGVLHQRTRDGESRRGFLIRKMRIERLEQKSCLIGDEWYVSRITSSIKQLFVLKGLLFLKEF